LHDGGQKHQRQAVARRSCGDILDDAALDDNE
jgi:hypothetical protein